MRQYLGFVISVVNNWVTYGSLLATIVAPIFGMWFVMGIALFLAFLGAFYKAFVLNEQRPRTTVQNLQRELESAAKAQWLLESCPDAKFRIVQVLRGTSVGFSIILYSEQACQIGDGTLFEVYRTDQLTMNGLIVPKMIGIVRATSPTLQNRPFEAELERERKDAHFWRSVQEVTASGQPYNPPRNEAIPYIPARLRGLSATDMETFAKTLDRYRAGV